MNSRTHVYWIAALPSLLLAALAMAVVAGPCDVPHAFVPGNVADANQVNQNFAVCESAIDDNDTRISVLETAAPPRSVRGHVGEDGSVVTGSGFAVTYSTSGNNVYYTVQYDYAYAARPVVLFTLLNEFSGLNGTFANYGLTPHPTYGWVGGFVLNPQPGGPVTTPYELVFSFVAMDP